MLQVALNADRKAKTPLNDTAGVGSSMQVRELEHSINVRVCQQALLNQLEAIFETVFDEANFGYRKGRSAKDALSKVWKEIKAGDEWIVDADQNDFFGSVEHEKLMALVG